MKYFTDELSEEKMVLAVIMEYEDHPYRKSILKRVLARLENLREPAPTSGCGCKGEVHELGNPCPVVMGAESSDKAGGEPKSENCQHPLETRTLCNDDEVFTCDNCGNERVVELSSYYKKNRPVDTSGDTP